MKSSNPFHGIICPILTPFDQDGKIDISASRHLVDHLIQCGIQSLMVGGTTGELPLLSLPERKFLAEEVLKHVDGRATIIVHAGCPSTAETLELARHARDIQAHAVSVLTPYFFPYSEEELYQHFNSVAQSIPDLPLSLYSFPDNAKNEISPNLVSRLVKNNPNIMAIKSSNINLIRFQEYAHVGGGNFNLLCGVDALTLPALSLGACGQVSGNSNVFPEPFIELYRAFVAGDLPRCRELQKKINIIRSVLKDSIPYFKAAMSLRGIDIGSPRLPMLPLSKEQVTEMDKKFKSFALL